MKVVRPEIRAWSLAAVLMLALSACGGPEESPAMVAGGALPPDHPPLNSMGHPPLTGGSQPASGPRAVGVVQEAMDVAGYTYARVVVDGEEAWLAGPETALAEGDRITVTGGMPMENFHSNSLDRTFDVIYFVNAFIREGEEGPAAGSGGVPNPHGNFGSSRPQASAASNGGTVVQAFPAAGYTYVEVETEDGSLWLAGPEIALSAGDRIRWEGGMVMRGFESKALQRTFDEILFVDALAAAQD